MIASCSVPQRKVLFIGVDGLASWCLETALDSIPESIPNIVRLRDEGLWTMDKRAEYKTSSAINWATLFMGVPQEMHGYSQWNSARPVFTPYALTEHGMPPTLFTLLRQQKPEARSVCVYDWTGIGPLIDTLSVSSFTCVAYAPDSLSSIDYTARYGVPVLKEGMPDLFFFYSVDVDETGHKYGWGSTEYYEAIVRFDKALGLLLGEVKPGTTVVLTSDHGGKPNKKHGNYDIRDFRTPLFVWDGGKTRGEIVFNVMQYDLTAYIAGLLGLKLPAEWRGRPEAITAVPARQTLDVMTFNVRLGTAKDGEHSWEFRRDAAAEMIQEKKPAVFGVQEAYDFQLDYLLEKCPVYQCVGVGRNDGGTEGEHMSVFYDTGRMQLKDWGTYWLSETPDVPSKGWDAKYERTATWLLLFDKQARRHFYLVNTHLDHRGIQARAKGLQLITDKIASMNPENYPLILMGDLNVHPDDSCLDYLRTVMVDSWESAPRSNPGPTWHGYGKEIDGTPIDYIFYTGFRACKSMLRVRKSYAGVPFVSDHYPVIATLVY